MTTTPRGSVSVAGGITALNPQDGLFLRAEHLQAIQTYAQELTRTVAVGSGTGVVYGFDVSLGVTQDQKSPALKILPGLAISPTGQSLRSSTEAVVPLAVGTLDDIGKDGFWVITVNPWSKSSGNEKAYGSLCDEPCSDSGSAIQPWLDEGVTISLVADTMPGLAVVPGHLRRNWLASQYFERERKQGDPWLVPGSAGPIVAPIGSREWTDGIGQPASASVPLGVVQLIGQEVWTLDVWTARRDVGGAPADNAWRSRLAMRPWNVFLAEILQFQDQVRSLTIPDPKVENREVSDERDRRTEEFLDQLSDTPVAKWKDYKDFRAYRDDAGAVALGSKGQSLQALGLDELPPAGYLDGLTRKDLGSDSLLRSQLQAILGTNVNLRICHVRADYIAGAVEEAQHLDRIPLSSKYGKVDVDVLVPDTLADLEDLRTGDYGWVAFVRRRESQCETPVESVEVYYQDLDYGLPTLTEFIEGVRKNGPSGLIHIGPLSYPAGGWDYPDSPVASRIVKDHLEHDRDTDVRILALASDHPRRPLAALRGSLFAASLDQGRTSPQVWSIVPEVVTADAIVVIQQDQG